EVLTQTIQTEAKRERQWAIDACRGDEECEDAARGASIHEIARVYACFHDPDCIAELRNSRTLTGTPPGGSPTTTGLPGANPKWGKNRLTKELHDRGFVLKGPTRSDGGLIYENPQTGEQVRIMPRPNRTPYRSEPPEKFENSWYYRYKPGGGAWGPHT